MRPRDHERANTYAGILAKNLSWLPGISEKSARAAFVEQLIESIRRVEYIKVIMARNIDAANADPHSDRFDTYKAAIFHAREKHLDEAFWLVFLATLVGKHRRQGWLTVRDIYGALGGKKHWTWSRVVKDPDAFRAWLAANKNNIRRYVGNHRKYLSLDADKDAGIGAAVVTYVDWVQCAGGHSALVSKHVEESEGNPRSAFNSIFRDMSGVASFGRTARFDYLTMLSKLEFAPIEADSPYMQGATGPYQGARKLFGPNGVPDRSQGNSMAVKLAGHLKVSLDVIEDALCNWQKSPNKFIPFRG